MDAPKINATFESKFGTKLREIQSIIIQASSASTTFASPKRFLENRETVELRDDLALAKEEGTVSKEVISVLRKQLETMEKEKETM